MASTNEILTADEVRLALAIGLGTRVASSRHFLNTKPKGRCQICHGHDEGITVVTKACKIPHPVHLECMVAWLQYSKKADCISCTIPLCKNLNKMTARIVEHAAHNTSTAMCVATLFRRITTGTRVEVEQMNGEWIQLNNPEHRSMLKVMGHVGVDDQANRKEESHPYWKFVGWIRKIVGWIWKIACWIFLFHVVCILCALVVSYVNGLKRRT